MQQAEGEKRRSDRRTALMLFNEIRQEGYTGGYSTLTDFVRNWRQHSTSVISKSAFVPLKFELGEAFQFDWSEEPF